MGWRGCPREVEDGRVGGAPAVFEAAPPGSKGTGWKRVFHPTRSLTATKVTQFEIEWHHWHDS